LRGQLDLDQRGVHVQDRHLEPLVVEVELDEVALAQLGHQLLGVALEAVLEEVAVVEVEAVGGQRVLVEDGVGELGLHVHGVAVVEEDEEAVVVLDAGRFGDGARAEVLGVEESARGRAQTCRELVDAHL